MEETTEGVCVCVAQDREMVGGETERMRLCTWERKRERERDLHPRDREGKSSLAGQLGFGGEGQRRRGGGEGC